MFPKDKEYDLIIVGGGLSGLTAAVSARDKGLKTLVLEKGRSTGGGGNYVEGIMGVGSRMQKETGIKIKPTEMLQSELQYSHYEANASHLKKFIDESGKVVDWLEDLGVKYVKVGKQGESWPTIHSFEGGGASAVKLLLEKAKEKGAEIVTSTSVQHVLMHDGHVSGVIIKNEATGKNRELEAKNVILATGGYVDNPDLVKKRMDDDRLMSVSTGKSTGDGMKLAWEVGAKHASMGAIQYGGGAIYDKSRPQFVHMPEQLAAAATQEALLWVNERGERFVNEDVNDNMCHAGAAILTQSRTYSIMDQASIDYWSEKGLYKEVGNSPFSPDTFDKLKGEIDRDLANHEKFLTKADTVEELAEKLNLPHLSETVNHYNSLVVKGEDTDFGKKKEYLHPVSGGPYYAVQLGVGMACALGGIRVDNDNAVLNPEGYPLEGLYAVGNDAAGMIVGDTYAVTLPGSTCGYACFSARNAVEKIAKE